MKPTFEDEIEFAKLEVAHWSERYANEPSESNRRMRAEAKRRLGDLMAMRNGEIRKNETQSKESFV